MNNMFENIKQQILKYWFIASSLALVVLYLLFDKRGREINQLHTDAQTALLAQQLADIKQRSTLSEEHYEKASQDYASLRARHGQLLAKLGLPTGPISKRDN